jgi:arylsulfatase A-like enzyme
MLVQNDSKTAFQLTLGLLAISALGILATYFSANTHTIRYSSNRSRNHPNILILGGDGLSARYMSVYGYELKTTPFITELAKNSLVVENAFNNASSTTGSTTSLLTGKYPIRVNVIRYPDILTGNDSFEHLPGILKRQGYQTVEIGTPYYVDAQRLNLLDGFDIVNNQSLNLTFLKTLRALLGNSPSMYFLETIIERSSARLLHIFFVREMDNPLVEVNSSKSHTTDDERTQQIIELLSRADRPLFIFAHLMDTHGPEFSSDQHVFYSGSSDEAQDWDMDLYKDALLSYDVHIKEIYDYLVESGTLDNTIIVIYTDHGYRYTINQRIPMIIHFPQNTPSGIRKNNVQVMDIPVTLLDYLDITRPKWMSGISILDEEPPADRKIISVTTGSPKKIAPPFNQIKIVQMIICQKWFALNVQENSWESGLISGHTSKCKDGLLPPETDIRRRILDYLEEYGFDISSLQ